MSVFGDIMHTVMDFCIKQQIPREKIVELLNDILDDTGIDSSTRNIEKWVDTEIEDAKLIQSEEEKLQTIQERSE